MVTYSNSTPRFLVRADNVTRTPKNKNGNQGDL